jgi:outer membrane murein-binding lipoprotein Lpp
MHRTVVIALAAAVFGAVVQLALGSASVQAAGPSLDQLAAEVATLRAKVTAMETRQPAQRASPGGAGTAAPDPALASLKATVDQIASVLQVSASKVTLSSPGTVEISAGSGLTLKASGATTLESAGVLQVKGAMVKLNNGSRAVAYQGAKTAGSSSSQVISEGSTTVFVP